MFDVGGSVRLLINRYMGLCATLIELPKFVTKYSAIYLRCF